MEQARLDRWFDEFLVHRSTSKPSPNTLKAYRQDFAAISGLLAHRFEVPASMLSVEVIGKASMREVFAQFAATHQAASIRRCWSTWNLLCDFLFSCDVLVANPMSAVLRPKAPKSLPKALPQDAVSRLVATLEEEDTSGVNPWGERDLAVILTGLLTGLRSAELICLNVGDIRDHVTDEGEAAKTIFVHGKGNKERVVTAEPALVAALSRYLITRIERFPESVKKRLPQGASAWAHFRARDPLFVGGDGQRMTRGTLQYRVLRAFRRAGINGERAQGALTHQLRHTFATVLADEDVNIFTLMRLLGHESMTTTQRYTEGSGTGVRAAAASNPIYKMIGGTGADPAATG